MKKKVQIVVSLLIILIVIIGLSNRKSKPKLENYKEEIHYVIKESFDGSVECISELVKNDKIQSDVQTFKSREDCWASKIFKDKAKDYNEKQIVKRAEDEKKAQEEAKIKEKKYKSLISKFRIKNDKIENLSFYEHKSNFTTSYGITLVRDDEVRLYIGKQNGHKWLRFEAKYDATNWLFIESFLLYVDGENFSKTLERDQIERGNYTTIWEIVQLVAEGELLSFIEKIPESKESIIRYKGKYDSDKKISDREKKAIKETLDLYELL